MSTYCRCCTDNECECQGEKLSAHPASAEAEAVSAAIVAWQNGDDGARDRLNAILASWTRGHLPLKTPPAVADQIAMTITAGILPYLSSTVLRLAEDARKYMERIEGRT